MRSLRDALYLVAIALMVAMYATAPGAASHQRAKPKDATCVAPEGWTARIEQTPYGWACVLRSGRITKAFFY